MNKVKKTTIWDRIRKAARALRGKPADSIELGLAIKRCDQCKRGDCDSCVYKGEFERLMELPNCNDCALNASSYSCNYRPRIGENVRINCPMWKPKRGGTEKMILDSGAVRDIQEGKGRCDLMPLDVVAKILDDPVLFDIYEYQTNGQAYNLADALDRFTAYAWDSNVATLLLEASKHFEEGAKKYGENNWQKGIPTHCYIDSAVRHYLKWLRGDDDEPHARAFVWNLLCCIWTCEHIPEMDDYRADNLERRR